MSQALIEPETFSVMVFMVIVATLVTPLLLRWLYRDTTDEGRNHPRNSLPTSSTDLV